MKYGTQQVPTVTSGSIEAPRQFTIQNSQIAFETLSSRLYTDPIRAVIRELACNAADAHSMTGETKPFLVNLPTYWEPNFSIRDFGPGMDHEQILSLYCTYFSSSKTDRNDAIGAFGLGSKSPFAYFLRNGKPGGFSVISYQKGEMRTYSAFIDNGFPKIELQAQTPTTEPDGLEIMFPVETKDVAEFDHKAEAVFEFFSPMPTFNKELNISRPEYSIQTSRWGVRADGNGTLRVVMGGVVYDVGNIDSSRLEPNQQAIASMPVDMFMNMGEVNPAVSRENLQLDGFTIEAIKKVMDEISTGVVDEVKKQLESANTTWEARLLLFKLVAQRGIGGVINSAYNSGVFDGAYTNFSLGGGKDLIVNELDFSRIQVTTFSHAYRNRGQAHRDNLFNLDPEERKQYKLGMDLGTKVRSVLNKRLDVKPEVVFVQDDMKKGRAQRYVNAMIQKDNDSGTKIAYLISVRPDADLVAAEKEIANFLEVCGNPPVVKSSELKDKYIHYFPKAEYIPRERGLLCFAEKNFYDGKWRGAWYKVDESIPLPDGDKYFVVLDGPTRAALTGDFVIYNPSDFLSLLRIMRTFMPNNFGPNDVIYGLRKNSKLRKAEGWVEFIPFITANAKNIMTTEREDALSLRLNPYNSEWKQIMEHLASTTPLHANSPIQKFAIDYQAAKDKKDTTEQQQLRRFVQIVGYEVKNARNFENEWNQVEPLYPILEGASINTYYSLPANQLAAFVEYFKMEEAKFLAISVAPVASEDPKAKYKARKAKAQKLYMQRRKEKLEKALQGQQEDELVVTLDTSNSATALDLNEGLANAFFPIVKVESMV